jgi:hypothetical protein
LNNDQDSSIAFEEKEQHRQHVKKCMSSFDFISEANNKLGTEHNNIVDLVGDMLVKRGAECNSKNAFSPQGIKRLVTRMEEQTKAFHATEIAQAVADGCSSDTAWQRCCTGDIWIKFSKRFNETGGGDGFMGHVFQVLQNAGLPNLSEEFNSGVSVSLAPATPDEDGVVVKLNIFMLLFYHAAPVGSIPLEKIYRRFIFFDRRKDDDQSLGFLTSVFKRWIQQPNSACSVPHYWTSFRFGVAMQ